MSKLQGKIYLRCNDFNHPNKPHNDCRGDLIDVGGLEGSTTTTRLRCRNPNCQRVITIAINDYNAALEEARQRRFQKATKD